jgi:hypothetical protein
MDVTATTETETEVIATDTAIVRHVGESQR